MASDTAGNGPAAATLPAAGADVAEIARATEPDRYLAALLAPAAERAALMALAAFAGELARIPLRAVREPFMGEIRLEWWRTALAAGEGESVGHHVADAMRRAIRRHDLPLDLIDRMIDARALDLVELPFADDAAVDDYLWGSEGVLFALAGRVMGLEAGVEAEAACRAAGHAYGLARMQLGLARSLSLGRVPLAQTRLTQAGMTAQELLAGSGGDAKTEALLSEQLARIRSELAEARRLAAVLSRSARVAFLPLALVRPYVRLLERQGSGALRAEAQVLPLTRVWKIAVTHLLGRL